MEEEGENLPEQYKKNMPLMYIANLFANNWMILPISLLYFLESGISFSQLAWMEVINGGVIALIDIPSGSFADKFGRKRTVILATLLWGFSYILIGLTSNYWFFLVANVLLGISEAASSGSNSALIYDSLSIQGNEADYVKAESRLWFIAALSLIGGSMIGGWIYGLNKSLPWIIGGSLILMSGIFIGFMKEPPISEKAEERNHLEQIKEGFRMINKQPRLKFLLFYSTFVIIPIAIFGNLIEQPYLVSLGFNYIQLGILYAVSRGVMGALIVLANKLEKKLQQKSAFYLVHLGHMVIFMILAFILQSWAIIFMFTAFFLRDFYNIIAKKYINQEISSDVRATVLSIQNVLFNIGFSIFFLISGYLLELISIQGLLLCIVGFLAIGILYLKDKKGFKFQNIPQIKE